MLAARCGTAAQLLQGCARPSRTTLAVRGMPAQRKIASLVVRVAYRLRGRRGAPSSTLNSALSRFSSSAASDASVAAPKNTSAATAHGEHMGIAAMDAATTAASPSNGASDSSTTASTVANSGAEKGGPSMESQQQETLVVERQVAEVVEEVEKDNEGEDGEEEEDEEEDDDEDEVDVEANEFKLGDEMSEEEFAKLLRDFSTNMKNASPDPKAMADFEEKVNRMDLLKDEHMDHFEMLLKKIKRERTGSTEELTEEDVETYGNEAMLEMERKYGKELFTISEMAMEEFNKLTPEELREGFRNVMQAPNEPDIADAEGWEDAEEGDGIDDGGLEEDEEEGEMLNLSEEVQRVANGRGVQSADMLSAVPITLKNAEEEARRDEASTAMMARGTVVGGDAALGRVKAQKHEALGAESEARATAKRIKARRTTLTPSQGSAKVEKQTPAAKPAAAPKKAPETKKAAAAAKPTKAKAAARAPTLQELPTDVQEMVHAKLKARAKGNRTDGVPSRIVRSRAVYSEDGSADDAGARRGAEAPRPAAKASKRSGKSQLAEIVEPASPASAKSSKKVAAPATSAPRPKSSTSSPMAPRRAADGPKSAKPKKWRS